MHILLVIRDQSHDVDKLLGARINLLDYRRDYRTRDINEVQTKYKQKATGVADINRKRHNMDIKCKQRAPQCGHQTYMESYTMWAADVNRSNETYTADENRKQRDTDSQDTVRTAAQIANISRR